VRRDQPLSGRDGENAVVLAGVIALVLLVALIVVIDRYLAGEAERRASAYLAAPLGQAARVQVHARPFLTQAIRGRYHRVEVTGSDLQFGTLRGTTLQAHLTNAYLPLRDLLGRRARELPVERVHGELLIPYRELARASRVPGVRFFYRDERLIVTARLPVPGIGQAAGVSGEAIATISADGGISVRVRNLAVAGFTVTRFVLSQLVPNLEFAVPLPPLPYGLRIEQLVPTDDGLRVFGSAHAVVFRADPAS
jgi:hypothetical protein